MVVAIESVDSTEMAQSVLAAPRLFVDFGEMAMSGDQKWIAGCRASKALERVIDLAALAIEQAEAEVNFGVAWQQHRSGLQMANCTPNFAILFEQRGHAQMSFEIARLLHEQVAAHRQGPERIGFREMTGLFEALAHAGRAKTFFDFPGGPPRRAEL